MRDESVAALKKRIKDLERQVKRRGRTIGGMYGIIEYLQESCPYRFYVKNTTEEVSNLKTKLEDSRKSIIELQRSVEDYKEPVEMPYGFSCNICFDPYDTDEKKPVCFQCGHLMCESCLIGYTKSNGITCPKCRRVIESILPLFV